MAESSGRTRKRTPGIRPRHREGCRSPEGGRCSCSPAYEAWAFDAREGRKLRRTFPTLAAAKAWRADATRAVRVGTMRAVQAPTLREAAESWLAGARDGSIRNRSGDAYKPSAIRGYDAALSALLPDLGATRLDAITRNDIQAVADRLLAAGRDPSTIRNAIMPLRVIYRRALARGEVALNPTAGLELPAVRGRRDRIADPAEAAQLLAALSEDDRPLWATALYAGLRRGELMSLAWEDVDLAAGLIRVERSYDPKEGEFVAAKTRAGRRRVPIAGLLREALLDHKLRTRSTGLVFGRDGSRPFDYSSLRSRAAKAWKDARLAPIGLHEARHTFASLMIAAGVNAKALSTYLGHANIAITMDRYGHLMPGSEDEAAGLLDAYLARADTAARLAQLDG
jgi:integrase